MFELNKRLKDYIQGTNGKLEFTKCPWANRYWHNATTSGFSDTYKVRYGVRHRRKYYIRFRNENAVNDLKNYLDEIKYYNRDIDYCWNVVRIRDYNILELTTKYTIYEGGLN